MNEVDLHIGTRIRSRRLMLRKSTETVAFLTGVDAEMLAAFEDGRQRVPATCMVKICEILDMRPLDIFRGYPYAEDRSEAALPVRLQLAPDAAERLPKPI